MRKRLYRAGLAWLMAVGVALLLRWLYVVWPNTLTAVLTPVSASPWEWGKALYWPVLAALLLLHRAEMRAGLVAPRAIRMAILLARKHRKRSFHENQVSNGKLTQDIVGKNRSSAYSIYHPPCHIKGEHVTLV